MAKITKKAALKVYEGGLRGMCTTMKDRVNEELLAFIKDGDTAEHSRHRAQVLRLGSPAADMSYTTTAMLSAGDHRRGNPHAAIWLMEYGDYECPFCRQAEPLVIHLVEAFGDRMMFVFRHFPQVDAHPQAELAAEAAEAAAAQGQFWPMHRKLFERPHRLGPHSLTERAASLGLDMNRFAGEMADRVYTQRVQEHRLTGIHIGLRATPTFLLNGSIVDVSFGLERLEMAVRRALQAA